ncbi:MAG: MBL fold metallo-hydrolase [Alphaproteobacteria bacterium]|nr:MBL fold metallo-hydrolase [Alphaproteobacteria bacterium]
MLRHSSQLSWVAPLAGMFMGLFSIFPVGSGLSMSSAPEQTDVHAVIEKVLEGIGGRAALQNLSTISLETVRRSYVPGQGLEPGSGFMTNNVTRARITYDLDGKRQRSDIVLKTISGQELVRTELIDGNTGFTIGTADSIGALSGRINPIGADQAASNTKIERLLNPYVLLKEALIDSSLISLDENENGEVAGWHFTDSEVLPITVARERQSGKRTLITSEEWLNRLQSTDFFGAAVQSYEIDAEWLGRWHDNNAIDALTHVQLRLADEDYPIFLHINLETGRISKLQTMQWDVIYGDVSVEVSYHDYQEIDGLTFPMHIMMSYGGAPSMDVRRSNVLVNPKIDEADFTIPTDKSYKPKADVAKRGSLVSRSLYAFGFAGAGRPEIGSVEIDTGVYLVYAAPIDGVYTMVVEQEDGVVVIEPGMNDLKGEEVIKWIGERFPGKPITHLFISHFHNDHSGGLRPYVASGAALVVHEEGASFYRAQVNRPKSKVMTDALDRNPADVEIISIPADETYRIEDALRPIVVYPIENAHTSDLLFAVLERQGIIYTSDLYVSAIARMSRAGLDRPPGTPDTRTPFHAAVSLAKAIDKHKLDVPVMIGSHDRDVVPYDEFRAYLDARD